MSVHQAHPGTAGERRLHELGLDVQTIHAALLFADAERATYTEFDAPGAGEYARWSRHVRHLSESLIPRSWFRINPDNQPTLVSPNRDHCLVVTSGNGSTGKPYATPSTRNPKGRSIREAVSENADLALLRPQDADPTLAGLRETWMLLTFVDLEGRIQSEVSLPTAMEGEFISEWQHRILLPFLDPSEPSRRDDEEPPEYEFSVVRK
jgi:hypothetical protein